MLGKLMKHEIIASYRTYIPIYGLLYLLSFIMFVSYKSHAEDLMIFFFGIYMLVLGGLMIFIIYNLIVSLGIRMYGKPGYLLFSTPASTQQIFLSKYIINFVWIILSAVVFITSLIFTFYILGIYGEVSMLLGEVWDIVGSQIPASVFVALGIAVIVYPLYYVGFFVFLFAMLNVIYKGEHKILIGVLFYFVLSYLVSTIMTALLQDQLINMVYANDLNANTIWYFLSVYFAFALIFAGSAFYLVNKKLELQ